MSTQEVSPSAPQIMEKLSTAMAEENSGSHPIQTKSRMWHTDQTERSFLARRAGNYALAAQIAKDMINEPGAHDGLHFINFATLALVTTGAEKIKYAIELERVAKKEAFKTTNETTIACWLQSWKYLDAALQEEYGDSDEEGMEENFDEEGEKFEEAEVDEGNEAEIEEENDWIVL